MHLFSKAALRGATLARGAWLAPGGDSLLKKMHKKVLGKAE